MAIVCHGVAVIRFRIDPGNDVTGVHLFRQPVFLDILAVPQLYTVIPADSLIDDHAKVVKKDLAAPAVNEAVLIVPVQGFHDVFKLIVGRGRPGDV